MYIHHALINALSTHIIHINLNTIFYTQVGDSPNKTIYIRHYMDTHTHTHIHTHTLTVALTYAIQCQGIFLGYDRISCNPDSE